MKPDDSRPLAGFWAKARASIGRVPFLTDAVAAWYCATDPATPSSVKALLVGALAYFVVPVDAIPDFVAGIGLVDDAAVLAAAVAAVRRHMTAEHFAKAQTWVERQTGTAA